MEIAPGRFFSRARNSVLIDFLVIPRVLLCAKESMRKKKRPSSILGYDGKLATKLKTFQSCTRIACVADTLHRLYRLYRRFRVSTTRGPAASQASTRIACLIPKKFNTVTTQYFCKIKWIEFFDMMYIKQ